jgi:hypothetical protein
MITSLGVSLTITGLLALVVVDNFKPECSEFKKMIIKVLIILGMGMTITGLFV